ncbi:enolase-phosphatase E1-like [Penaeus monodon]|uniref:enolase-phosphatase E1-like n=1 Tax=Penaeus monodon TaxID=6687 RepID=UPI0018A75C3A|nr:enolase-phosphatase E1-like [Penaeus monodon]XP_037780709.1 enolase-phosphatase E1-like [Penaeus monodon]
MKRHHEDLASVIEGVDVIMLDIEGTTTSISFVKDELFPFVRREVRNHLAATWEEEETKADVAALTRQVREDLAAGVTGWPPAPRGGRRAGAPAGRPCGQRPRHDGRRQESGCSQDAAGTHVAPGIPDGPRAGTLFDGHFDTAVGPKVESESYSTILRRLRCDPARLLFVTDLAKEAWAARAAGVHVVVSVREGTAPLSAEDKATFPTVTSFAQLLQAPAKKARSGGEEEAKAREDEGEQEGSGDEGEGKEGEKGGSEGGEEEDKD